METTHGYGTKIFPKFGPITGKAVNVIDENFNSLTAQLQSGLSAITVPTGNLYLVEKAWGELVAAHAAFISAYGVGTKGMN